MRRLLTVAPWLAIGMLAWRQIRLEDETATFAATVTKMIDQTLTTVAEQMRVVLGQEEHDPSEGMY